MRKLLAAFLVLLTSCATVAPKAENTAKCTADKIVQQRDAILSEVIADLAAQNYVALLTELAMRVGQDVVTCAVQEAYTTKQLKAVPGADTSVIKAHAAEYLRSH